MKINNLYRLGGVGIILDLETVTPGIVKRGFRYKIKDMGNILIKDFDNNFLPQFFEHPCSNIFAIVSLDFNYKNLEKDMILEPYKI